MATLPKKCGTAFRQRRIFYYITISNNGHRTTGKSIAGKKFSTFSFVIPTRFNPSANMTREPEQTISATTASVKNGATNCAKSTIPPWNNSTNDADSITPMPSEEANTIDDMKSSTDFVNSIS